MQAEAILADGCADLIGMCRQLICDPETPKKAIEGRETEIRHCVACYEGCGMVSEQEGVVCIQNPSVGREELLGIGTIRRANHPKKIMVIGGGIAGLKTAEILAKRGHKVSLYEKSEKIGGQMLLAEKIPYRAEHNELYRYLTESLKTLDVPIILKTNVTVKMVHELAPDCVIVATGSHPTVPEFPEAHMRIMDPRYAITHIEEIGQNVVLIDKIGYWQGMGTADYISEIGVKMSIVTERLLEGVDIVETCRENLNRRLAKKGVKIITSHRLVTVKENSVILENIFNQEKKILDKVDTLVVAQESLSDNDIYRELKRENHVECHVVGDAEAPGTALRIVFDAEELGRRI